MVLPRFTLRFRHGSALRLGRAEPAEGEGHAAGRAKLLWPWICAPAAIGFTLAWAPHATAGPTPDVIPTLAAAGSINDPGWLIATCVVATGAALVWGAWNRAHLRTARARVRSLLERADCILWEARVTKVDNDLQWEVKTEPSALLERLFPDAKEPDRTRIAKAALPADQEAMDARARVALETGAPFYEQEIQVTPASGRCWLHERVNIAPVGPNRWNLTGIVVDITERKLAREKVKQAHSEMINLLAHAECALWSANVIRHGDQLQWQQFEMPASGLITRLFGTLRPTKNDKLWSHLDVPNLAEMNARSRQAILAGAPDYAQEFLFRNDSGGYWLREKVSIFPAGRDEFHLVGVIMDVSDQHAAEEALAVEKERLAVTLSGLADGVIATDRKGSVSYLNPAAAKLTETELAEALGKPADAVCVLRHEETGQPLGLPLAAVVADDRPIAWPEHANLHGPRGGTALVEGSCAPLHDPAGAVVGTVIVFRDITQRERLGREKQRASRLESIGLLAGGIAHDFNNVLTVIAGNISAALIEDAEPEEVKRGLEEAAQAAIRARDLTQQLLTFARGGSPIRAAVSLPDLLRESTRLALQSSTVTAEFDWPEDLWLVDGDGDQITRVIHNIVLNAVEAMSGSGTIHIRAVNEPATEATQSTPGDFVLISIQDGGPGIDAAHVGLIFDPYFTTKPNNHGLGLATAFSIVKRHLGQLQVESTPGTGATFHIRLPVRRESSAASSNSLAELKERLQGRVLFLDDEPGICRMAANVLRRLGLTVVVAYEGEAAIEACRAAHAEGRPFDLLILDLTIPGGTGGRETLAAIRTFDRTVKAVVSSGYSNDAILANFSEYGFSASLAKPYQLTELIATVRRMLAPTSA